MKSSRELRHEENFDTLPRALSSSRPPHDADGEGEGQRCRKVVGGLPLAVEMGRAAPAKNQPYAEEEVTQLLLDTAKAACRIAWLDAGVRTTL
jgi:hypothetical protein